MLIGRLRCLLAPLRAYVSGGAFSVGPLCAAVALQTGVVISANNVGKIRLTVGK
jgi:hypothetical protein